MTGPLNITSPHAAGIQGEILYGTAEFQVRIWTLAPHGELASFPQGDTQESQLVPVTDGLQWDGTALKKGLHQTLNGSTPAVLRNTGSQPAILLEVCWGSGFQPLPLAEVTEERPWGSFTVLKDEPQYKLKELMVKPGSRLSLQRHAQREEHWLITAGQPEFTLDDARLRMHLQDYIHIPRGSWHRITNPGPSGNIEIIELQLGDYFGEDDIERREDDYGRA